MKTLILIVLLATAAFSQDTAARYIAFHEATSSTADNVTVQQPTSSAKVVVLEEAWVYCSVECDAQVSQGCAASTTTQFTPTALNSSAASTAKAYYAGNGSSCTALGTTQKIAAGSTVSLDLSKLYLAVDGTARNVRVAVSGSSGTSRINVQFVER